MSMSKLKSKHLSESFQYYKLIWYFVRWGQVSFDNTELRFAKSKYHLVRIVLLTRLLLSLFVFTLKSG